MVEFFERDSRRIEALRDLKESRKGSGVGTWKQRLPFGRCGRRWQCEIRRWQWSLRPGLGSGLKKA